MYAYKNGCEWNKYTCDNAAKNGHLECLEYAHKNGYPLGEDAAMNGHLDCLQYAHENGFPWDKTRIIGQQKILILIV